MAFSLQSNKKLMFLFFFMFYGSVDDNSWQGEAKIDMDYFHQVYKRASLSSFCVVHQPHVTLVKVFFFSLIFLLFVCLLRII